MPAPPVRKPATDSPLPSLLGLAAVALLGTAVAVQPLPPETAPGGTTPSGCRLSPAGFVAGRLYGDLETALDWRGPRMRCDGQLLDGDGLRLMFAGPVDRSGDEVVLVLNIGGTLAGVTGSERPASVTVIDQRTGLFYATGGPGRCWTRVLAADAVADGHYRLTGNLYCAGALPALRNAGSITLGDIRYAGRLDVD